MTGLSGTSSPPRGRSTSIRRSSGIARSGPTHQTNDNRAALPSGTRINCAHAIITPREWSQEILPLSGLLREDGQEVGRDRAGARDLRQPDRGGPSPVHRPGHGRSRLDGPELKIERTRPRQKRSTGCRPEEPVLRQGPGQPMWGHFLGRGLVEPIDDMRAPTRPATPSCPTPWPRISSTTVRRQAPDPRDS